MNGPIDDNTLNQLASNFHNNVRTVVKSPTQAKVPTGVKGFLINSLPAIGGGIGAVAGIPGDLFSAGASSVAGGAGGAALGEGLKQKLLGQSISPKQVAIQAGEGGALSSVGSLLRGGGSAAKALTQVGIKSSKTAPEVTDAVTQAVKSGAKPTIGQKVANAVVNRGQEEQANLGGFAVGQKVGGARLDTDASQRIGQTLQNEGINGLTARDKVAQIDDRLKQYNTTRNALYNTHNVALGEEDKTALAQAVDDNLGKMSSGTDPNVQKAASLFTHEALNQGDLKGLAKYKTSLDKNIMNYNRNPASAEPGVQRAAEAVRQPISQLLQSKVPGLAEVDKPYSDLKAAKEASLGAAAKTANISTGSGGLVGRVLGGETAEKVKGATAKAAVKAGSVLGGKGAIDTGAKLPDLAIAGDAGVPTERGLAQEGAQKIAGASAPPPPPVNNPTLMNSLGKLTGQAKSAASLPIRMLGTPAVSPSKTVGAVLGQLAGRALPNVAQSVSNPQKATPAPDDSSLLSQPSDTSTTDNSQSASPYPQENMLYDIERDPKNASTYEALYKLLDTDTQTTSEQNQNLAATNALAGLQTYADTVAKAGGSRSGVIGGLENLGVKAHLVQGSTAAAVQDIKSQKYLLATQIVKALTGSSRQPSVEAIQPYLDALPDVSDTPAEAKQKMSSISTYLNSILSNTAKSSADNTDLSSLLATP